MSGKEIILLNEKGESWRLTLIHHKAGMQTFIRHGWRIFCAANGMTRGRYTFKLVRKSGPPVIRLCLAEHTLESESNTSSEDDSSKDNSGSEDDSSQYQESEKGSFEDDSSEDDSSKDQKKRKRPCAVKHDKSISQEKKFSRCKASSSSYNQDRFVTLTLTLCAVKHYKLILPVRFTRANGLIKPGKITLLSNDGVKQVVDLLWNNRHRVLRIGKGWREFCEAHGVKIGEPFVLELIWGEEASPVLKFCTKLNSL